MTTFNPMLWQQRAVRELEQEWADLTFENDFVFGAVLRSDLDLCRRVLEAVLDVPIDHVELTQTQRVIDPSPRAKSIRLDVYVADGFGTVYDIEMQRLNATNLSRRARYYQSLLDAEQLDKGADYDELPDTYVIFFCTFDPFRKGYRRYTFRQCCIEDPTVKSKDGTGRIFLNSSGFKGEVSEDLSDLLQYLNGGYHCDTGLVADIDAGVKRVLSSDDLRRQFVMLELKLMDERREARRQGHEEGWAEGMIEGRAQGRAEGLAEGRAEGLAEGRAEGLEEGRAEGLAEGKAEIMTDIAKLKSFLAADGREAELLDALSDTDKLSALFAEFGLE